MINAMFDAARKRLYDAIEYRYAVAVRSTASLRQHHVMCLGQRYGKRYHSIK